MKFSEMPYNRVDFEKLQSDFRQIIEDFKNAKSGEEQFEVHKRKYKLSDAYATVRNIANVRHDSDTSDEFYDAEQSFYDTVQPQYRELAVEYSKLLYSSPYREYLEKKIGSVAFKNMEIMNRSFKPELVPLKQEENALTTKYSKLLASAKIEWNGEILNLSMMRKYRNDKDRATRKRASEKTTEFFMANRDELDDIYDRLVKNRTQQARLLGHKDYLPLGYDNMGRNDYGIEQVERFRKQVKEVWVPFVSKLHERRRERLGLDKMYYYDEGMNFPDGNPAPKGTPQEILENGRKMYGELSPETKEFYSFMMENELFDVEGRKNKRGGGYMTYFPEYKAPFIFANFNGTEGDVDVITHECGHAFHGYITSRLYDIDEYNDITMETAEIHSMSMEFFAEPWISLFFGEDTEKYLQMHLEDAATFIPYGCMVDEFQHIVYRNPDLTPAERRQKWIELEREYRPYMDYEENEYYREGGYWQAQHHIYSFPLYYIDYCLAQTIAFQYKVRMDEDYKKAWDSYLALCKMSAKEFFSDMLITCGLKTPFEDGCLREIVDKLSAKLGL